jgi:AcrR family transcriptional regulator
MSPNANEGSAASPRMGMTRSALPSRTAEIVEKAAELFAERGFDATSIQDIAEAAGIRKASVYAHVTQKDDLLRIIFEDYIAVAVDNAQSVYASDATATAKLTEIVRFLFGSIGRYRSHVAVFLQESRYLDSVGFEEVRRRRDVWERTVVAILRDGMESGEFRRSAHPRIQAFLLVGMVQWTYRWYLPTGDLDVDDLTEMAMELIIRGIGG